MVVFLLFGRGACFCFCCLGGVRVFFFAVWAGGGFFFLLFGPGACFFAVWAGVVFFSLLFGRGTGAHSLTGLPGSSLSDPTTKKTKQQKKATRVPSTRKGPFVRPIYTVADIRNWEGLGFTHSYGIAQLLILRILRDLSML